MLNMKPFSKFSLPKVLKAKNITGQNFVLYMWFLQVKQMRFLLVPFTTYGEHLYKLEQAVFK